MAQVEMYLPECTNSLHELWYHVTACRHLNENSHHCYTEQHGFVSGYLMTAAAAAAAAAAAQVMWNLLTAAHADLQLRFVVG